MVINTPLISKVWLTPIPSPIVSNMVDNDRNSPNNDLGVGGIMPLSEKCVERNSLTNYLEIENLSSFEYITRSKMMSKIIHCNKILWHV